MENKVIIQGEVMEVAMLKETGRMLDIFGVKIRKAEDGTEVTVECEASELDKRLLPGTKIAVLGYHTDKDEDGEPADRIVAKTLNYWYYEKSRVKCSGGTSCPAFIFDLIVGIWYNIHIQLVYFNSRNRG